MRMSDRLSGRFTAAVLAAGLLVSVSTGAGAAPPEFKSTQDALEQGVNAYGGRYYEIAIPALTYAASHGELRAQFYLARLYADNSGARTDHAKAYDLYHRIVIENADIDGDDVHRAPFVAKSLTSLAGYLLRGMPKIGLRADPARAAEYLHHAATIFNDEDAQFELAKLYMRGEGVALDPRLGTHWLSVLTQKGHAGAQAFLADLLWRGKYVRKDANRALALVTVALENAPPHERIWIEDIYQNIFCGTSAGVRRQADGLVAVWRQHIARPFDGRQESVLNRLVPQAERLCSDGEQVVTPELRSLRKTNEIDDPGFAHGSATGGFGLMDAGQKSLSRPR